MVELEPKPQTDSDIEKLIYFTQRRIDSGRAVCWVYRQKCLKCGEGLMGKPRDKTGKVKVRAKEYVCSECDYSVEKKEYEEGLTANIEYVCPRCKFEGKTRIPFKRKKVDGIDALVFKCEKCGERILITKKMKELGEAEEEI